MPKYEIQQLYLYLQIDMLLLMTLRRWIWTMHFMIPVLTLVGACGNIPPQPTFTPTLPSRPSTPSITPSPLPTTTVTPDFCILVQGSGKIRIMSEDLFTALEPGGPAVFDRILAEQNPAWATFRQEISHEIRSAGVTFHETAFGPELGTGVNPAVLLVTYGLERNWELPTNGDLVSEVDHIRAVLRQHESDWILGKVDQSQYPMIANGATYALYRYFHGDLSKLEDWCHTFVQVYGESPLK